MSKMLLMSCAIVFMFIVGCDKFREGQKVKVPMEGFRGIVIKVHKTGDPQTDYTIKFATIKQFSQINIANRNIIPLGDNLYTGVFNVSELEGDCDKNFEEEIEQITHTPKDIETKGSNQPEYAFKELSEKLKQQGTTIEQVLARVKENPKTIIKEINAPVPIVDFIGIVNTRASEYAPTGFGSKEIYKVIFRTASGGYVGIYTDTKEIYNEYKDQDRARVRIIIQKPE